MGKRNDMSESDALRIVVLLPCLNEGAAIAGVVSEFRLALPNAEIIVYDNGSEDDTVEQARQAGAQVRSEPQRGKGNVVRRMFSDVDADVYIMADGDGTYDASAAPEMVRLLVDRDLDMVVGVRHQEQGERHRVFRPGHRLGNALFTGAVAGLFAHRFTDVLSGYRCFSHRFVKSFPSLSNAFEIELELTVHALELRLPTDEIRTLYRERPAGTESKLNTIQDGARNLLAMIYLFKEIKPFRFFGAVAAVFVVLALVLGLPVVTEFFRTGLVPRFPTAILASGLMILGGISLTSGVILDSFSRARLETKRLFYQTLPGSRQLMAARQVPPRQ
jgi:glycosyltransferase involved in cell wall biosynthesis